MQCKEDIKRKKKQHFFYISLRASECFRENLKKQKLDNKLAMDDQLCLYQEENFCFFLKLNL